MHGLVIQLVLGMLGLALLIAFLRVLRGPTLSDRVVAMDLIAVLTVGVIVTNTAGTGQRMLLDAAMVIALVGFLGTIAYAWYVEKVERK